MTGEVWDTIKELCNDIPHVTTLSRFFARFIRAMRDTYGETYIHFPESETELTSVLNESAERGYPGCLGFMDGVHVKWDMCPAQWRHKCTGQKPYPTLGWQCTVNHHRRCISVSTARMGSVNDVTSCKYEPSVRQLRHNPMYKDLSYQIYNSKGVLSEEKGAWLSVDGGYLEIPELLVGDPSCLEAFMNLWNHFMESERKHVECAFGILKARFRILKLPLLMHSCQEIDDIFFTCCILHNMCLDVDGADDGWHLGYGGQDGL